MRAIPLLCALCLVSACREKTSGTVDVIACATDSDCIFPAACETTTSVRCFEKRCYYAPDCSDPPANHCSDADTFVSYPAVGICDRDTEECEYRPRESDCPGCEANCADACDSIECNDANGGCTYGGTCVPGSPPTCDYAIRPDGWQCERTTGGKGVCKTGACVECRADVDCDTANAICVDDTCQLPCAPGSDCDDDDPCTYDDACDDNGICTGTAITCEDESTTCGILRACNGTSSCTEAHAGTNVSCNDADDCTYDDHCDGSGDCVGTDAPNNRCQDDPGCGLQRTCNGTATCDEVYAGTSVPCNDLDDCTYGDHCDGFGACTGTDAPNNRCQDEPGCGLKRDCNGTSSCDEAYADSSYGCNDGDICTENDHCNSAGGCTGDACSSGDVCFPSHGCFSPPTFTITTGTCANLGVSNTTLTAYAVTGPPGARVVKYNRHTSCGHTAWEAASETPLPDGQNIAGNGEYVFSIGNTQPWTNCENGMYGVWESYAEVDGVATNAASMTFYNHRCYDAPNWRRSSTCSGASTFCSPCNDDDGCPTEGEYCDVYGAGDPICREPFFWSSPTCADLGTAHWGTDLLQEYRVYGPEGARVHKYNRHTSCGGSWGEAGETSGSVVRIGSSGYYSVQLGNHDAYPCGGTSDDIVGAWDQYATVGDDSEEHQQVTTGVTTSTYRNSQCSGYDTCTNAASYCGY